MYRLDEIIAQLLGHSMEFEDTMIISQGGAADLPELKYKVLFWKSCYSGVYFVDNLNRGVVFYTLASPSISRPTVWIFLNGLIRGNDWESIKRGLNNFDDIHDYYDFTGGKSKPSAQRPIEMSHEEKMNYIEYTATLGQKHEIKDWIDLLNKPSYSLFAHGEYLDSAGEILAARWALKEMGEPALTSLIDGVSRARADVKANYLYALSEFDDPRALDPIADALTDRRGILNRSVESLGRPLRICDVAYNILTRKLNISEAFGPLATVHSIEFRDRCIDEIF
jgi:hypothetical protein